MKTKKGFSLAEVLIAMTIAGIIATIGFSIAKKGVARAYDQYVFTAYQGISEVVTAAYEGNGFDLTTCVTNGNMGNRNACRFSGFVYDALSGRDVNLNNFPIEEFNNLQNLRRNLNQAQEFIFRTPNNTVFHFQYMGARPALGRIFRITMYVPAAKHRIRVNNVGMNISSSRVTMLYIEDVNSPTGTTLIPYYLNAGDFNSVTNQLDRGTIENFIDDIQNRMDLLPFYLDDGFRGRVMNGDYQRRIYRSAHDAMCLNFNRNILSVLNCPNRAALNPQDWETTDTILRIANPRAL